jgi:hypothetical protein
MALTDSVVPKLQKDGSNAYHWEAAFKLYAKAQGFRGLLDRTWEEPEVIKADTELEPTIIGDTYTPQQLEREQRRVREANKAVEKQYASDQQAHREYESAVAALQLLILSTVPKDIYETVANLTDVATQFETIVARYREQGVTEECTLWADFFKLRAQDCYTTSAFIDKFQAGLAKLEAIRDCKLSNKQAVYQFILAIDTAYPDYAKARRSDLRNNVTPVITKMCNELIDEARRDDPIKAANAAARHRSGGDGQPSRHGNGYGRGQGDRDTKNNRGNSDQQAGQRSSNKPPTSTRTYCKHCDSTHYGGGDNCWFTFPEKATPEWRQRNADRLKLKLKTRVNATALTDDSQHVNFSTATSAIVDISDKVRDLAGRGEYRDRLILDTGATDHLCNDRSKFISFDSGTYYAVIKTGAGPITVTQKGTIKVNLTCSDGSVLPVTFSNVLFAPEMFVSVLSHSQLRQKNVYYHGFDHKLYHRRSDTDFEIAYTPEIDRIPTFLLADDELKAAQLLAFAAANTPRQNSKLIPTRDVSLRDLHELFGHADVQTLRQLVSSTTGLRLTDVTGFSCEVCMLSSSQKQVSRRSPNRSTHFLHRVHVDIVGPVTPRGIHGEQHWIIYTDDYSRHRWIDVTDTKQMITAKFLDFIRRMKSQYNVQIAYVHVDNDTVLINKDTKRHLSRQGTVFEPSTPWTAHQNGVAESSNRLCELRSRAMIVGAPHIPKTLWPYASRYAIEVLNHTPTVAVPDGKTPQQLRLEHMGVANPVPNLHSFRQYGETGYVHKSAQRRVQSAKFDTRGTKMYFIGRDGSRIYLMWDPASNSVVRTSSVTWVKQQLSPAPEGATSTPESTEDTNSVRFSIPLPPPPCFRATASHNNDSNSEDSGGDDTDVEPELGTGDSFNGLEPTVDEPSSFDFDGNIDNLSLTEVAETQASPPRHRPFEAPRHLDISASLDPRNIITSSRNRRPTRRLYTTITHNPDVPVTLARCFAQAITTAPATTARELPPEPTNSRQARQHAFSREWLLAEADEYKSHDDNGTWDIVVTLPAGVWPLPTKWVYKYKVNDAGAVERYKARLVVCGNRQDVDLWRETYAAVARASTLKVLLAFVACLDLECEQADVITAFLNGLLDADEIVYIRLPDRRYAKLRKALYGLRRSPRLWYEELTRFLASIGFKPIEADHCVFKDKDGSLIMAYVDDIVFITRTVTQMATLKASVFGKYKCRDLGPIAHYLGIRVRRDRQNRAIELSMEAYIEKLVTDYHRDNAATRYTPTDVSVLLLKQRSDKALPDEVKRYQTIIGKLLYPASQLRLDVAFHVSFLARAMSNPTPRHYDYAIQVIDYLQSYKDLVMTYKAPEGAIELTFDMYATTSTAPHSNLGLHGYSDASFADSDDRKSTSGYLFKLAGGTVCHKSVKQKLVTTSTTEAEYVAMTFAAKEATWLHRLLHQLGYAADDTHPILLYGDNEPSIKLLHADGHHERTKHVDIYYHYVKERVRDGHLKVQHVRTSAMAADGLTKPLDRVAHERFLTQIGLSKPAVLATGP